MTRRDRIVLRNNWASEYGLAFLAIASAILVIFGALVDLRTKAEREVATFFGVLVGAIWLTGAALYLVFRRGTTIDRRTHTVSIWRRGILLPRREEVYPFGEIRSIRVLKPAAIEAVTQSIGGAIGAGLSTESAFSVALDLGPRGLITAGRPGKREDMLRLARRIAKLVGCEVADSTRA